MVVLCLKLGTLTLKSLLLPVTCYYRVRTAVIPPLCLRFRFAPIDGASTDLQRTYNGPTTDLHRKGVERKSSQGSTNKNKFSILPIFYQEKGSFTRIYYLENKLAINFIRIQLAPELCEEINLTWVRRLASAWWASANNSRLRGLNVEEVGGRRESQSPTPNRAVRKGCYSVYVWLKERCKCDT